MCIFYVAGTSPDEDTFHFSPTSDSDDADSGSDVPESPEIPARCSSPSPDHVQYRSGSTKTFSLSTSSPIASSHKNHSNSTSTAATNHSKLVNSTTVNGELSKEDYSTQVRNSNGGSKAEVHTSSSNGTSKGAVHNSNGNVVGGQVHTIDKLSFPPNNAHDRRVSTSSAPAAPVSAKEERVLSNSSFTDERDDIPAGIMYPIGVPNGAPKNGLIIN